MTGVQTCALPICVAAAGSFTDTGLTVDVQEGNPGTRRTFRVFSAPLPAGVYVFRHQSNRSISNYVIGAVPPPITAWGPDPFDGETMVDVNKVLSWSAPEDPNFSEIYGYSVYIDPNETKVVAADPSVLKVTGLEATSFDPALLFDRTYFWRVDVSVLYDDDPNQTPVTNAGPVWHFATAPEVPMIVTEPKGQSRGPACGRPDAVFTVEVSNATNYQWYKNGQAISGATSATLTIVGVTPANEGQYYCHAYNAAGSVDSATVWLDYARQTSQWDFEDSFADVLGGHTMIPAGVPEEIGRAHV